MKYYLLLTLFIGSTFFLNGQTKKNPEYSFDHILIFVSNDSIEKTLNTIFTQGTKLETVHENQGTFSRFYLFYNTYIELIFERNLVSIEENLSNFGSDYWSRWGYDEDICKLGIGTILTPFDSSQNVHVYHSKDSPDYYIMEKANRDISDVLVYSSRKDHTYQKIESIADLKKHHKPPYLQDFEEYCQHPSGIKKMTRLHITVPNAEAKENLKLVSKFEQIEIENGDEFKYIFEFDNHSQKKTLTINKQIEIRY